MKIIGIQDQHQQKKTDQNQQDPDEDKEYIQIDRLNGFVHVYLLYTFIPGKKEDS